MAVNEKQKCACWGIRVHSQLAEIRDLVTKPLLRPKWKEALKGADNLIKMVDKFADTCDYPKAKEMAKKIQAALIQRDVKAILFTQYDIWDICKET